MSDGMSDAALEEREILSRVKIPKSPDSNVEHLREMLLQRSHIGLLKYGVTTDRSDLTLRDWLQHALEETLDQAVYLSAAIKKLDSIKAGK